MRTSFKMVALFGAVALLSIVAISGGAAAMGMSGPHMSAESGNQWMNGNSPYGGHGMMGPVYTSTQPAPVGQAPVVPQTNHVPTGYPGMMSPGYYPANQQVPVTPGNYVGPQVSNTPATTVHTPQMPMYGGYVNGGYMPGSWMSGIHMGIHVGAEAGVCSLGMHW